MNQYRLLAAISLPAVNISNHEMSFNVECTVVADPIAAPTSTNAVVEDAAVEADHIHLERGPRDLSVSQ